MRRETRRKAGVRTAGVLFLVVMGVLVTLSIKVYDKDFVSTVPVTLKASRIGNQLSPGGQVKARGVLVGEIRGVRATPQGAEIATSPRCWSRRRCSANGTSSCPSRTASARRTWPPATSSSRTARRTRSSWNGSSTTCCRC
jgi:hypothetical protein